MKLLKFNKEDHFIQIPILRQNLRATKKEAIKETFWDNRVYRISTFNEICHSHYRKLFEDLSSNIKY